MLKPDLHYHRVFQQTNVGPRGRAEVHSFHYSHACKMKVAFLDHYDSFSFNLIDWLREEPSIELTYVAHDDRRGRERLRRGDKPLVVSPGPLRPELLLHTQELVNDLLGRVPIFGVCLGHQFLGVALGGTISPACNPFHGSRQGVMILKDSLFINSLSTRFLVGTYNSLVVDRRSVASKYVWAENEDGEIAGLYWDEGKYPALSVQYHPESFLSDNQEPLRQIWLGAMKRFYGK